MFHVVLVKVCSLKPEFYPIAGCRPNTNSYIDIYFYVIHLKQSNIAAALSFSPVTEKVRDLAPRPQIAQLDQTRFFVPTFDKFQANMVVYLTSGVNYKLGHVSS